MSRDNCKIMCVILSIACIFVPHSLDIHCYNGYDVEENMQATRSVVGLVFDIQRFCIEDGPGIRTTVFLKGCSIRCPWCSNPESFSRKPQLAHFHATCLLCGSCVQACPEQAIAIERKIWHVDRNKCTACGQCVSACTQNALKIIGQSMSCAEVVAECLRDKPFYEESGGGITLSGGEPASQAEFSATILEAAQRLGIHTAVETNGFCPWPELERIARHTDLFLFDLKILDGEGSKRLIGADPGVILENLERIDRMGKSVIIRFPIIPGYTDDRQNIEQVLSAASRLRHAAELQVLPFHQYGKHKYRALDYPYGMEAIDSLTHDQARQIIARHATRLKIKVFG